MEVKEGVEVRVVSKEKTKEYFGYVENSMLEIGDADYVLWVDGEKVCLGNKYVGKAFLYHIDDLEILK